MDQDIFYDTSKLSRSEQEAKLRKAYSICERWWFDKLDCRESIARQRVKDISFEDAMEHFVKGSLMVVIHRRYVIAMDEPYLEVGFRSMESPIDYFLWIIVPLESANEITTGMTQLI
jgi:hypothetical protein